HLSVVFLWRAQRAPPAAVPTSTGQEAPYILADARDPRFLRALPSHPPALAARPFEACGWERTGSAQDSGLSRAHTCLRLPSSEGVAAAALPDPRLRTRFPRGRWGGW